MADVSKDDEYLKRKHDKHLENYWPTLVMACLFEGVAFFFTSPGPVHVGSMSKDERIDDHVDGSGPRRITCKYGGALLWRLRVNV